MKIDIQFKKTLLTCALVFCFNIILHAQNIKGNITDAKTGETLIGATVTIENGTFKQSTTVGAVGSYLFKNVPAGTYKLFVSYVGYKNSNVYDVNAGQNGTAILNLKMVDNSTAEKEVTITEHADETTERSARSDEKNSNNTINVVSAQSIAISPDVFSRKCAAPFPGISIDRNDTGDAQHV